MYWKYKSTSSNKRMKVMKDDEDDIDEWINDKLEASIIKGHPLENPIIGNLKTLNSINKTKLLKFHKKNIIN